MDKKKLLNPKNTDDLKGFEEFIDGVSDGPAQDKNPRIVGGEALSFILNDNIRLKKISQLVSDQLPLAKDHSQGERIIEHQRNLNRQLKNQLHAILNAPDSTLQKSLSSIWDNFFNSAQ